MSRFRWRSLRTITWSSRSRRQNQRTFCDAILPWTLETGSLRFDAEALHGLNNFVIEVAPRGQRSGSRRRVVRKRFAKLLRHPGAGRMPGDVEMQDLTPVVGDHEEAIEHAKCQRWHSEEVHCGDSFTMIGKKRRPSLCRLGIPRRPRIQFNTVRSEISKPSIFSSP
jgi:hypothetical protein